MRKGRYKRKEIKNGREIKQIKEKKKETDRKK
jgi:hypothetical protein